MTGPGHIAAWSGLAFSTAAAAGAWWSAARSRGPAPLAKVFTILSGASWTAAVAVLLAALWRTDLSLQYVAGHVAPNSRLWFRLASLWAGQEGSLLLWTWLLAVVVTVWALRNTRAGRRASYTTSVLASLLSIFGSLSVAFADPFVGAPQGTGEPLGSSQLHHWAMLVHPPLVFAGYALLAAPFAMIAGGLLAGHVNRAWIAAARSWAMVAWLCLGAGIVLGAWWAYTQLGWGGYWAWDPVENAALLPWLVATAFLHSQGVYRRRAMLAGWTCILGIFAFVLCVFGAFLTRGGMVESVHSFTGAALGAPLAVLVVAMVAACTALLAARIRTLPARNLPESIVGREWIMLLATVLMTVAAAVVVLGTMVPVIATKVFSAPISMGRSFYESMIGPVAVCAAALLALSPAIIHATRGNSLRLGVSVTAGLIAAAAGSLAFSTGAASALCVGAIAAGITSCAMSVTAVLVTPHGAEARGVVRAAATLMVRARVRWGRSLAHGGFLLLLLGVCVSTQGTTESTIAIRKGETVRAAVGSVTLEQLRPQQEPGATLVRADLRVHLSDGNEYSLSPLRRHEDTSAQPMTVLDIRSSLARDVVGALSGWDDATGVATVHVVCRPCVSLIWLGAAAGLLGGIACFFPGARAPGHPERQEQGATRSPRAQTQDIAGLLAPGIQP